MPSKGSLTALRIALLGAPGSGKTQLAQALRQALASGAPATPEANASPQVADGGPLQMAAWQQALYQDEALYPAALAQHSQYDITLLMGLDLPWDGQGAPAGNPLLREKIDGLLRAALTRAGLPYQVIYGQGPQRLANALMALDRAGHASRTVHQFGLARGRVVWRCETCDDGACERGLFTGLGDGSGSSR